MTGPSPETPEALAQEYFDYLLTARPTWGHLMGEYVHADLFEDVSRAGEDAEIGAVRAFAAQAAAIPAEGLSDQDAITREMIVFDARADASSAAGSRNDRRSPARPERVRPLDHRGVATTASGPRTTDEPRWSSVAVAMARRWRLSELRAGRSAPVRRSGSPWDGRAWPAAFGGHVHRLEIVMRGAHGVIVTPESFGGGFTRAG